MAALVTGSLLAGVAALQAQTDTNTPPVGAPPGGGRGMRGGPTLDQLATALSLTDDQKAKVKPILDARDQKVKDLRADTSLSQDDRRTKMQSIRQETSDALKAVLTADQFTKYQQLTQRGRRPGGGGGGGNAPTNPPANPPQQ